MRIPRLIDGLNNSQRIRVIVDGVGFFTTVAGTSDICTHRHRVATQIALMNLANSRYTATVRGTDMPSGFGFNYPVNGEETFVSVQVDLL